MHRLLARQIKRTIGSVEDLAKEVRALLEQVDTAYAQYDEDRAMLERSLELSSTELLQANGELNAIFRALPDLFIRVTRDGHILDVRNVTPHDLNICKLPSRGLDLSEVLADVAHEAIQRAWPEQDAELSGRTVTYTLADADKERHYEARLLPLPHNDLMIVIRDATSRVHAVRAQAMEEFAYVASHDLRAPLRAVKQLSVWLSEDLNTTIDDDAREALALLRLRVERMDSLLVGLLDYAQAGRQEVELQRVDVGALVADVIDMLGELDVGFEIGELPVLVTAQRSLERVFLNLITNAVKHHDKPGGVVAIRAIDEGEHFAFSVLDDGPGIPPSERRRVFKLFRTLRRRDEVEGAGMGLALIKRIVEDAGGEVRLDDGLRGGACFTFTWPKKWHRR